MTYHATTPALRRYARRPQAPLGFWPFDSGSQTGCLDTANAKVAPLDDRINALSKTWNPSGFYAPDDILRLVSETLKLMTSAGDQLRAAPLSTSDAASQKDNELKHIAQRGTEALDFIDAAKTAKAQGINIVDAPGLRSWVIRTMGTGRDAITVAEVLNCEMPGLASAIIAYQGVFDVVSGVVVQVLGVVVSAGDAILHLPDTVGSIFPYLKWGAVAGVALWAFLELRKRTA